MSHTAKLGYDSFKCSLHREKCIFQMHHPPIHPSPILVLFTLEAKYFVVLLALTLLLLDKLCT